MRLGKAFDSLTRASRSQPLEFAGALEELLDHALDDMLQLDEIVWVTSRYLGKRPRDPAVIGPALEVIGELLDHGFAIVGDLDKDDAGLLCVSPWGVSPDAAVERIRENWNEVYDPDDLSKIPWFEPTEGGRAQARRNEARRTAN